MKKEISIDQLARMVQKGFTETNSKMDTLATKEGLERLEGEVVQMREEIFKQHSYRLRMLEAEIKSIKEQMLLK